MAGNRLVLKRTMTGNHYGLRLGLALMGLIAVSPGQAADVEGGEGLELASIDASPPPPQNPTVPINRDENWDWLELTSGEWLKGEIKYMYDEKLHFDSDVLGDLTIDWDDIEQIISPRRMTFRLNNRTVVSGSVQMEGGEVVIKGMDGEVDTQNVVSMVPDGGSEWDNWSITLGLGVDLQQGNTSETAVNTDAEIIRRTALTRYSLSYDGNFQRTNGETSTDNQTVKTYFDYFFSKEIFIRPAFAEYYRDPFQNLSYQVTAGAGLGYQIIDDGTVDWNVVAGPAVLLTRYDSVEAGNARNVTSPAAQVRTNVSYDITDDLTYEGDYTALFTDSTSGLLNTSFDTKFSYDITEIFAVFTKLTWNRTQEPTQRADGTTPKKDDYRMVFGLEVEY